VRFPHIANFAREHEARAFALFPGLH